MLIKKFTQLILRSNINAAIVAMLCAFLPLLSWVSMVIVALVTLCKTAADGFVILLWAALPYIVVSSVTRSWWSLIYTVLFGGLFVWMLAIIWKRYQKFNRVIETAVLVGVIAIVIFHGVVPNPHIWWTQHLLDNANKWISSANLKLNMNWFKQTAPLVAPYMTGVQCAFILLGVIIQVIIARALQANLVNSWIWRKEWREFRISQIVVIFLALCLILFWIKPVLLKDLLPVLVFPLLFAGVSLVHSCMIMLKIPSVFTWLFYLLIFLSLLFLPFLLGILVLLAVMDSFLNFRLKILKYRS
ncbi:MAG: hypothetical protein PVG30_00955 [Gammaproteobacteria bacterium]|jgi:hypothetical protein